MLKIINVDCRLLYDRELKGDALKCLLTLATCIGEDKTCFPSRQKIMDVTGWEKDKTDSELKKLKETGYLEVSQRRQNGGKFTSNKYKITTRFVSIFIALGDLDALEEKEHDNEDNTDTYRSCVSRSRETRNEVLCINSNSLSINKKEKYKKEKEKPELSEMEVVDFYLSQVKTSKDKYFFEFEKDAKKFAQWVLNNPKGQNSISIEKKLKEFGREVLPELPKELDTHPFRAVLSEWIKSVGAKKARYLTIKHIAELTPFLSNYEFCYSLVETAVERGYQQFVYPSTPQRFMQPQPKMKRVEQVAFTDTRHNPNTNPLPKYIRIGRDWVEVEAYTSLLAPVVNGKPLDYDRTRLASSWHEGLKNGIMLNVRD